MSQLPSCQNRPKVFTKIQIYITHFKIFARPSGLKLLRFCRWKCPALLSSTEQVNLLVNLSALSFSYFIMIRSCFFQKRKANPISVQQQILLQSKKSQFDIGSKNLVVSAVLPKKMIEETLMKVTWLHYDRFLSA